MSSKIEVVAYANGDELSNLLGDRTATVVGVADGWRGTGLVRFSDHQSEADRLTEWARANQQLAQGAMDKLEDALADCDLLKMHLADHRTTLDAMSSCADSSAPVVERQPYGYWICQKGNPKLGSFHHEVLDTTEQYCDVTSLYTAPPELAELQALSVTNIMLDVVPGDGDGQEVYAKSVADVEAALTKQYDEIDELQATIAQQAADFKELGERYSKLQTGEDSMLHKVIAERDAYKSEIERLKGGQGELVHQVRSHGSDCWEDISGESLEMCKCQQEEYEIRTLFTSQPAPVSVDAAKAFAKGFNLLEQEGGKYRITMSFQNGDDAFEAYRQLAELRKCLDKVKELNQ